MVAKNTIESEKLLEVKLKAMIEKELKGLCIKLSAMHFTGLPDRLCLVPYGKLFFCEVKTTKMKPKRIQQIVHDKIRLLGFKVYIVDSTEIINQIKHEQK